VVARIAPYANIAGWNFVWEVDGDDGNRELELARLLQKYDIFNHLRTYEDEEPSSNEYERPEYTFAAVENHGYTSDKGDWGRAWTHHEACLDGYVSGKPVYMSEGNALWRRYWHQKINSQYGSVDQNDLRQSAWACATAAASFCWNGHAGEDSLVAFGEEGLPFFNDNNSYKPSALAIDVVADVMNKDVRFYRMTPHDELLSSVDDQRVWCLAEIGHQYLVFSTGGDSFSLNIASGTYSNNKWIDTKNGSTQPVNAFSISGGETRQFSPPSNSTDWVLVLNE
jgi:hypothetical protein